MKEISVDTVVREAIRQLQRKHRAERKAIVKEVAEEVVRLISRDNPEAIVEIAKSYAISKIEKEKEQELEKLLTKKEVAEMLGVSVRTLTTKMKEIPHLKQGSGKTSKVLFKKKSIINYIKNNEKTL